MNTLIGTIIETAESYIGKQEINGNMGFKDPNFEDKMRSVGFQNGYAWCALFTELVWRESYAKLNGLFDTELNALFSASAVKTYNNFKDADWQVDISPRPGDVVIWRNYKNGHASWTGHAGIVTFVGRNNFTTCEGNTNSSGGREGIEVAEKVRKLDLSIKPNGLNILGFIHPKSI